jgi:hypothetical protein
LAGEGIWHVDIPLRAVPFTQITQTFYRGW